MFVKHLTGPLEGEVIDVAPHAAEALRASGQAILTDAKGGEVPLWPDLASQIGGDPDRGGVSTVVTAETDAAGEQVVEPVRASAKPVDEIATRATDGREAEPRRATEHHVPETPEQHRTESVRASRRKP